MHAREQAILDDERAEHAEQIERLEDRIAKIEVEAINLYSDNVRARAELENCRMLLLRLRSAWCLNRTQQKIIADKLGELDQIVRELQ